MPERAVEHDQLKCLGVGVKADVATVLSGVEQQEQEIGGFAQVMLKKALHYLGKGRSDYTHLDLSQPVQMRGQETFYFPAISLILP